MKYLRELRRKLNERERQVEKWECELDEYKCDLNEGERKLDERKCARGAGVYIKLGERQSEVNRHGYTIYAASTIKYGAMDLFCFKLPDGSEFKLLRKDLVKIEMADTLTGP